MELNYLCKDGRRYHGRTKITSVIYDDLTLFCQKPKKGHDNVFDEINGDRISQYSMDFMDG